MTDYNDPSRNCIGYALSGQGRTNIGNASYDQGKTSIWTNDSEITTVA